MERQFLNLETVKKACEKSDFFESYFLFEEAGSSNDIAKKFILEDKVRSGIIVVNKQKKGRGRTSKTWISEYGSCLTFSLVLDSSQINYPELLSLIAAKFVHRALISYEKIRKSSEKLSIKWPNDIYAGNKKICGILTEAIFEGSKLKAQVIGIGLNFSSSEFNHPELINAGSIKSVYSFVPKLEDLFLEIIASAIEGLGEEIFDPDYINANSYLNGKMVNFSKNSREERGRVLYVDNRGNLLIRLDNSEIVTLNSGSVFLFNK